MPETTTRCGLNSSLNLLGLPNVPEEKYRPRHLKEDIRLASVSITVFLAVTGLFVFRDYQFLGLSAGFYALAALRLGFIGVGFFLVRFLQKVTDYRVFDRVIFAAFFAAVVSVLIINATRPADYIMFVMIDLAAVSAMYLAVPFKLSSQVFMGLVFSVGDVAVVLLTKDPSLWTQLYTIIPAFAVVNIVGFGLSRRLQASRCREMLAREAETQAVEDREKLTRETRRNEKLEAIGLAAAGVARDFDSLFNIVADRIELARQVGRTGTEIDRMLGEAAVASKRGRELSQGMLGFSTGTQAEKRPVFLADLVRDTFKGGAAGSNLELKITIPEVLMAEVDPPQISHVLKILLANAREAMPGGGMVRIAADRVGENEINYRGLQSILTGSDYVRLTIADNGPGIPEAVGDKVFQPFFSTKPGSSGLGLAMAYAVIKSHGGYITLEPNNGKGAVFSIYLPAGIAPSPVKEAGINPGQKATILVIESEYEAKKTTGRMLNKLGYDCEMADDGPEAVKICQDFMKSNLTFAAVLLDPDDRQGAGPEALRLLREQNPAIKFVAAGNISDDAAAQQYKDRGYAGVVNKPYTLEQLREALSQVLS
jgi:signal transduction histidine kinase/ActR/RegA family two-component response regulator